jgi:hypothetical protein
MSTAILLDIYIYSTWYREELARQRNQTEAAIMDAHREEAASQGEELPHTVWSGIRGPTRSVVTFPSAQEDVPAAWNDVSTRSNVTAPPQQQHHHQTFEIHEDDESSWNDSRCSNGNVEVM